MNKLTLMPLVPVIMTIASFYLYLNNIKGAGWFLFGAIFLTLVLIAINNPKEEDE